MQQLRSLDRRPSDPTPEQIRTKCAEIQARWAAVGDKRFVPALEPAASQSRRETAADWALR